MTTPLTPGETNHPGGQKTARPSDLQETWASADTTTPSVEPTTDGLPRPFGRYRLVRLLGKGGMGEVYLAEDEVLRRTVALKIPSLSTDPEVVSRFYQEAQAAANLSHPNICPVYDVDKLDGVLYLTMAYVKGRPLSDLLGGQGLDPDQAVTIVYQAALALEEAHRAGVVHRDLKPSNIIINDRGSPVIMDFGLARRNDQADVWMRQAGTLIGTPAYMAPEQVRGDIGATGPSCDIYSLGVVLYELLTGRLPFSGGLSELCDQILHAEPPSPCCLRPRLDAVLGAICLRAIAKQAEDRHASMEELAAAIEEYLRGKSQQFQLDGAPSPCLSGTEAARLLGRAGEALFLMGRWDAAHAVLLSAVDLPGLPADEAVRQRNRLVHLCKNMDRWPEALEHSDTCLAQIPGDAPHTLVARVRINRGSVLYDLGDRPAAAALFEEALHGAEKHGATLELAAAANDLGIYRLYHDELDQAEAVLRRGLEAAGGQSVVCAYLETNLGLVLLTRSLADPGRMADAGELFERVLERFRRAGHLQGTSYALSNRGICEMARGRWDRAEEDFLETISLANRLGEKWSAYGAQANRALLGVLRPDGNPGQSWEMACGVVGDAERNHDPKGIADASLIAARAALALAAEKGPEVAPLAGARRMLDEAVRLFAGLGQRLGQAQACFGLAELAAFSGDMEGASQEERGCRLLAETALPGLEARLLPLPWHMLLLMELF